jgi:nucleoside-diphosphate-sugar epimerase
MRYLITGGAGFIGSHLVDALTTRGDDVLVLDDLSTGSVENLDQVYSQAEAVGPGREKRFPPSHPHAGSVDLIEGCVTNEAVVDDCMAQVDVCVHLASAVGVQLVIGQPLPSLLRNVRGCDNVITAAARHGRRLLFASTSEIYGKNSGESLHESADRILGSPFQSRWSYSTAKAFGEALAHGYHTQEGADTIVVRLFNTVGPRQRGAYGMVLPRFVRQALGDQDLTVYGSGTQSRCFVHVLDTVHALVLLLDTDEASGKVYNVGSRSPLSIIELAGKVIEQTDSDSKLTLVPYEEAYGPGFEELGDRIPDTSALAELTGWRPSRGVEEMIDDVIAYEQNKVRGSDEQVVRDLVRAAG